MRVRALLFACIRQLVPIDGNRYTRTSRTFLVRMSACAMRPSARVCMCAMRSFTTLYAQLAPPSVPSVVCRPCGSDCDGHTKTRERFRFRLAFVVYTSVRSFYGMSYNKMRLSACRHSLPYLRSAMCSCVCLRALRTYLFSFVNFRFWRHTAAVCQNERFPSFAHMENK